MPVKSANEKDNGTQKWTWINRLFGVDYDNYSFSSLMRLVAIQILMVTLSWIFLIIFIACYVTYAHQTGTGTPHFGTTTTGTLVAAIFFIILFAILWVVMLIINYYIGTDAKDNPILAKNWWWIWFAYALPWIFYYVLFFLWKNSFDNAQSLADSDLDTGIHFKYENDVEREEEVEAYRQKKEEILEHEKMENKKIHIDGKPIIGNKKGKKKK